MESEEETIQMLNLNMEKERKLWNEYLSNGLIPFPERFTKCNGNICLNEYNTLINPYVWRCSNPKCRKYVFLRENTLFNYFPKTPISIIRYIIYISLQFKKNAIEIYNIFIKDIKYYKISLNMVNEILDYMRKIIAHYMKDTYLLEDLAEENAGDTICVDESLFV